MSEFWKRFFIEQFHYSKFCFVHKDARAFIYCPWLPQRPKYQIIYLIYRWAIALYFIGWLIASGITSNYGPKFFIFLTYWNFMSVTGHYLFSAVSCTYGQLMTAFCNTRQQSNPIKKEELTISNIRDRRHYFKACCLCCTCIEQDVISWYHIVMWIGHTLAGVISLPIIVFYWGLLAGDHITGWAVNLNIHLIVGIPPLIDALVTGIPWRLYHVYVPMIFGAAYFIFSLIYDLAGGTNPNGDPYIYPGIDYSENPLSSIGFIILLDFIVIPFVHFLFWCLHVLRTFLLYHKLKNRQNVEVEDIRSSSGNGRTRKISQQPFLSPVFDDSITGNSYNHPKDLGTVNEAFELGDAPTSP